MYKRGILKLKYSKDITGNAPFLFYYNFMIQIDHAIAFFISYINNEYLKKNYENVDMLMKDTRKFITCEFQTYSVCG